MFSQLGGIKSAHFLCRWTSAANTVTLSAYAQAHSRNLSVCHVVCRAAAKKLRTAHELDSPPRIAPTTPSYGRPCCGDGAGNPSFVAHGPGNAEDAREEPGGACTRGQAQVVPRTGTLHSGHDHRSCGRRLPCDPRPPGRAEQDRWCGLQDDGRGGHPGHGHSAEGRFRPDHLQDACRSRPSRQQPVGRFPHCLQEPWGRRTDAGGHLHLHGRNVRRRHRERPHCRAQLELCLQADST